MRNICVLSGIARQSVVGHWHIQQTRNENLKIPFEVDARRPAPECGDGARLKVIGSLTGMLREAGVEEFKEQYHVAVFKALKFGLPPPLERPPQECFDISAVEMPNGLWPNATPALVEIAGYVGGIIRKPGVPWRDGRKMSTYLEVLIRQTERADEAVPVRIYGDAISKDYERRVRLGMRVVTVHAELRLSAKANGAEHIEWMRQADEVLHVRTNGLLVAKREHFKSVEPEWAKQLAAEGSMRNQPTPVEIVRAGSIYQLAP
jgi:hypothetical protein